MRVGGGAFFGSRRGSRFPRPARLADIPRSTSDRLVIKRHVVVAAFLSAAVASPVAGQADSMSTRAKPFAELSESAQRVRDSVSARVGSALAATLLLLPEGASQETALRDSITAMARAQLGTKYRFGAESPQRGFDCSGLVRFVLGALRIDLPRTARTQALAGSAVERDTTHLRPGDLLTFGRGKRVTHIGIYVGEGRFVHASTSKRRVVESILTERGWFGRHWLGARRVVAVADSASS